MRGVFTVVVLLAAVLPWRVAVAQSDLNVCHVQSSYDFSLSSGGLLFDRTSPAPQRVWMHGGHLQADHQAISLAAADRQRVEDFQQTVEALLPKARAIALRGVDLAAEGVREQARVSTPQLAASGELDTRLEDLTANLKTRIQRSQSTHDWHGPAFQQYVDQYLVGNLVPLLASDMLQQAINVAISGDLDQASALRDRAANLADSLRSRVRGKLDQLKPRIRALCPSLQKLDALETHMDARLPNGSTLNLLSVGS